MHPVSPALGDHDGLRAIQARLLAAGLRPTRQRLVLGRLIWADPAPSAGPAPDSASSAPVHRHWTAEDLAAAAAAAGVPVALATVYNTLNCLVAAGMLRLVSLTPGRTCFDTNLEAHAHLVDAETGAVQDWPLQDAPLPVAPLPPGTVMEGVDVIIRVRKGQARG